MYWLLVHLVLLTLTIMTQPQEENSEAAARGLFQILKISQENTCVKVCFITLQDFRPAKLLRCFPVKFEILKNTYFGEHL